MLAARNSFSISSSDKPRWSKGLRFETLEAAQAYLDRWEARWADTRIHGTTERQVAAMFAEERPALLPLPVEPFRYYPYGTRTVHLDGCVEIDRAYYPAPPGWIGRAVAVQWDGRQVRLLDPTTGQLLREHRPQRPGGYAPPATDQPSRTPPTTVALLARATRAGARIGALCEAIHRRDGVPGVRLLSDYRPVRSPFKLKMRAEYAPVWASSFTCGDGDGKRSWTASGPRRARSVVG